MKDCSCSWWRASAMAACFLVASFVPTDARAELFLYDGFDYEPGFEALTDGDGGIGWDGPWEERPDGRHLPADVVAGSLGYTDSAGNELLTTGNHVFLPAFETSVQNRRLIDISKVPPALVEEGRLGKDGTSVWLSFLMQTEGDLDPIWGGVSLFDGDFTGGANTTNRIDVGFKNDDRQSATFGMGFPGKPDPWADRSDVPLSELSYLVARFDFNELVDPETNEGEDEIFMWVNPRLDQTPDDDDALYLPFRRTQNADVQDATYMFDRIRVAVGRGDEGVLDEVRFGETFTDVAPIVGGGLQGDFNKNGVLDLPDIDDLSAQSAGGTNPADYDLDADALVDVADINVWINDLFNSWVGDADLDGEFNTNDLVIVLSSGAYEQDVDSVWSEGDFNGNGRVNTGDLVAALAGGGYEIGPRAAVAAVPEPSSLVLMLMGTLAAIGSNRRK